MRAFFCIELAEGVKGGLDGLIQELKRDKLWRAARVSWVKRENLHVTLRFLGEVSPEQVEELHLAAEAAWEGCEPFPLELDLLGAFPRPERPRVIWAGCSAPPREIRELYARLERELQSLSFPPEGKPYTPHVTLGRVKDEVRTAGSLGRVEPFRFVTEASGLTLMESRLDPAGAIYTPIFQLRAQRA